MARTPTDSLLLIAPVAALLVVSAPGSPGPLAAAGAALWTLVDSAWPALVYLCAAIGWGRVFRRITPKDSVSAALGLGGLLSLSHLLGVPGLFSGSMGPFIAYAPILPGLWLFGLWARDSRPWRALTRPAWGLVLAAALVPLVIACNPPGWLWDSEFGGYDALSYHLQLPQEWTALGRLMPLEHNVYSYLPGYMEAAFLHLGAMTNAKGPGESVAAWGLVAGSGWRLITCQVLHAGCAALAAWCIAGLVKKPATTQPAEGHATMPLGAASPPVLACLFALGTPWLLVTGTLAYNEMPMLACFAAACGAALCGEVPPIRRWCTAAALIAFAACAKPTALILCGVPVAFLLLATTPARRWVVCGAAGAAVGTVLVAPWLIRNFMASGNPVFPFAAGLFPNADGGTGHWSAAQVARYAAGHSFDGPLLQRLALIVMPDASDPAGARMRGILHPQWFAAFPAAVICLAWCLAKRVPRAGLWGVVLGLILVLWLFTTHVQSRFLIPSLVPICVLVALAAGTGGIASWACIGVTVAQWTASIVMFASQRGGEPNLWIEAGPNYRSAEWLRRELRRADAQERRRVLNEAPPEMYCNLALPEGATLLLVGGATPLYFALPVRYSTTWDTSPLVGVMEGRGRFTETHLLVDFAELSRLSRSNWLDPALGAERTAEFLLPRTEEVRSWPDLGLVLLRVRPGTSP